MLNDGMFPIASITNYHKFSALKLHLVMYSVVTIVNHTVPHIGVAKCSHHTVL